MSSIQLFDKNSELRFDGTSVGGGGSQTVSAATVRFAGDTAVGAGATVAFDHVIDDADGYWNAATHQFVIPGGKGGWHLVGFNYYLTADAAVTVDDPFIVCGGNYPNLGIGASLQFPTDANTHWAANGTMLANEAAAVTFELQSDHAGVVDGGGNGSIFWIVRMGD